MDGPIKWRGKGRGQEWICPRKERVHSFVPRDPRIWFDWNNKKGTRGREAYHFRRGGNISWDPRGKIQNLPSSSPPPAPFILPSLLPTVASPQEVGARARWWKEHVSRNRSHYRGFEADRNSNERKLEMSVEIFIPHCFSPVLSKRKILFHAEDLTLLEDDAEFF